MDISYDNVKEKFKAMINETGSDDIIEYPSSSSFPDEKDDSDEASKNPFSSTQKTKQSSNTCLLYTSPSPRDQRGSRMPSSA